MIGIRLRLQCWRMPWLKRIANIERDNFADLPLQTRIRVICRKSIAQ